MEYKMKIEDKEWVEDAIGKGFTKLQMRKKLLEVNYPEARVEAFCDYYDEIYSSVKEENVLENEEELEENVKKWHEGKKDEMSRKERKEVKRFLKQMNKYLVVLKATSDAIKKEVIEIRNKFEGDMGKIDKELENVKEELVDRIIDSKNTLDIFDPKTGKIATKELLMKNSLDILLDFFDEDIIGDIDAVVNGRVKDE